MSHFAVLLVLPSYSTDDLIANTLQPFHEYECTGVDDQYVVDVDVTEEVETTFASYTYTRWVDATGNRHDPYDDRFYRDVLPEDDLGRGPHGTGGNGKIGLSSRDWSDGKGYRTKVHLTAVDVGMTEIDVPAAEVKTIDDWAEGYGGWKRGANGRFIKHTNPNAQWDWFQVGGRYSGKLRTLSGQGAKGRPGLMGSQEDANGVDIAQRSDLDFTSMKMARVLARREWLTDIMEKADLTAAELQDVLIADPIAHEEWLKLLDPKPRGAEYYSWIEKTFDTVTGRNLAKAGRAVWDLPKLGKYLGIDAWAEAAPAFTTWAVVHEGQWIEKGSMGWWGISTGDVDQDEWETRVSELVETMPADHWLAVVDCHI